jgi:perosamine synthetase
MRHKEVIEFIQSTFATTGSIPLHVPIFSGKERECVLYTLESTFVSSVGAYVDRAEQTPNLKPQKHRSKFSTSATQPRFN